MTGSVEDIRATPAIYAGASNSSAQVKRLFRNLARMRQARTTGAGVGLYCALRASCRNGRRRWWSRQQRSGGNDEKRSQDFPQDDGRGGRSAAGGRGGGDG